MLLASLAVEDCPTAVHSACKQGLLVSTGSGEFSLPSHLTCFWGPYLLHLSSQPGPVTEVDGAIATDFFTVLSLGQHYTEDQWLNVQTFSMLQKWLLCYGGKEMNTPNSGLNQRAADKGGFALPKR